MLNLRIFYEDLTFRMYSTYIFKSKRLNLKQLFIHNNGEGPGTKIKQTLNSKLKATVFHFRRLH